MNSLRLFLIAGALFSWMATSHAGNSGGTIRFVGSIVESPCTVNIVEATANTDCYRNGKYHKGTRNLAKQSTTSKDLPLNLGTTQMRWVDKKQMVGIMTVAYR